MKLRRFFVLLLVVASVAAACGGDDNPADEAQDLVDDAVQDAAEDAGVDAGLLTPQECIEVTTALASAAGAAASSAGGTGADPSGSIASLQAMSEVAPDEIADDLAVIAGALAEYFEILVGAGIDFADPNTFANPEAIAAAEGAAAVLSDPAIQTAINNVSAGLEELCATG